MSITLSALKVIGDQAFLAQAAAPQQGGGGGGGSMFTAMLPMILIFGIFYFMLIRPQKRKEKERKEAITKLKTGERVLFAGGFIGQITNVKETTFIIKIADNTKVEVLKNAVVKVLEKGEKLDDAS
ncbi:MAG: preprotein translocase subunit YajC [Kiritimatiellae bacterium]|jgi:preprotein translocase subunit YajC|nr:preprotein translocase subunit YajC [Kiritimatiellia bacterium]